ncbi:helix-turn-helix transcriptional regulator [Paenibacillus eucommiae]|uniref:AraC-like DNA-binding protein n=1 Tax=Paenibacillus eucommiae TaxID=1355755 RepID=A0ABS4IUA3_9BACL|nr:AraC family transcriptional regulator [Paenibacillus eucommiae]MBP1990446.1 AraC-like DNA-binding protein [Paenibacillus eucommiae]
MHDSAYHIPEVDEAGTASTTEFLQVNCLGYYKLEKAKYERYRKKGRKDYLLIYNHIGKAIVRAEGTDHEVGSGTAVIYRPGEEQLYQLSDEQPIESYWIHFTGYGVEEVLERLGIAGQNIYYTGQMEEYSLLSRMAQNEIQAQRRGYDLNIASLMIQILTLLSRYYLQSGFTGKQLESSNRLDLSISYIHTNYHKPITVPELSDLAGLCVSRYIQTFKQRTGSTPKDYLIRFRLLKAKELLRYTNLTIRQISLMVGFGDQLYFSRVFKKLEGMCPSEARGQVM